MCLYIYTANTTADSSTRIFAKKSSTTDQEISPAENDAESTAEHAAENPAVNVIKKSLLQ